MSWWMVASAALPYVAAQFQDKPKAPTYSPPPGSMPTDRSREINELLDMARNPNSKVFEMASGAANENVNRLLARTGMGGSSIGAQVSANMNATLAAKFLEEEMNRRQLALGTALQYDQMVANAARGDYNAQFQAEMDAFNRKRADNAAAIQGLSGIAQAGVGMYLQQQARNDLTARQNAALDRMDQIYNRNPAAVPSYTLTPPMSPYYGNPYGLGVDYNLGGY